MQVKEIMTQDENHMVGIVSHTDMLRMIERAEASGEIAET